MRILNLRLWRMFKHTKGQYFAVLSVVSVGLLIFTALNIAAINLQSTLDLYYQETNFADIFAQVISISSQDIAKLERNPHILQAQGRHVLEVPVITEDAEERVGVRLISVTSEPEAINDLYLITGSYLNSNSDNILVIEQFAKARGLAVGDTLTFQFNGRQYKQQIQGIVASPEFVYLMKNEQSLMPDPASYGVIYVSDSFAAGQLGLSNHYNEIVMTLSSDITPDLMVDELEDILDSFGVKRIFARKNQLSNRMIQEELSGLNKSSSSMPILFLGVAGIIIMVMIQRMVQKDRTSIGILKSMGYTNGQIVWHYVMFALSLGLLGGLLGILLALILSNYMTELYVQFFNIPMLQFNLYYRFLFSALFLAITFCCGAGLWGAREVIGIMPAESMRPESPKIGKRILVERIPLIWRNISFRWKIVVRNLLRSKKRLIFIATGIALTYALTLFTVFMWDIFEVVFNDHYSNFQLMDYSIQFSQPISMKSIKEFDALISYEDIEPKTEFAFELANGVKSRVVNIIGLPEQTVFYHFVNLQDKAITVPAEGMLLSKNMADILGVAKGDTITVKSFIPNRDDQIIKVTDVIRQRIGSNAYMHIETMNELLLDKGMMTGVYLNSQDNVSAKLNKVPAIATIQSQQELRDMFKDFIGLMIIAVGFLVMMGGILGFAIVYTATSMSISERKMEFSSLRVMGFSKKEIYQIVVRENALTTVIGIIAGIPLGRAFLRYLDVIFSNEMYSLDVPAKPVTYILAALVTLAFIAIAQVATKQKINKLQFLEALKNRIA